MIKKVLLKIHLYVGLAAALFLLLVSITGCALIFENELEGVFFPLKIQAQPQTQPLPLQELANKAQQANPGKRALRVILPQQPDHAHRVVVSDGTWVYVNGYTGEILGVRNLQSNFLLSIHQLHTSLLLKNRQLGSKIVGWATLLLLLLAISGVILWWPRKLLTIKRGVNWRRVNFDLHNVSGFYAFVFVFLIALTGVLMTFEETGFKMVYRFTGEPPNLTPPRFTPQKGAPMISPDQALQIARAAMPGAMPTTVGVAPANSVDFKFPEDRTPMGRSHVFLDPYTGQVQMAQSTREAHPGVKAHNLNRPLHTGDILGWPTRIIWFVASLMVVIQAVTGVLIWWKPRRKKALDEAVEESSASAALDAQVS